MRNEILAVLVILLGVGGLAVGYLDGASGRQTTTSTATVYTANPYTQTITVYSDTFTSTSCTYTNFPAEIACPHFWNQSFTFLVNYTGAWIASYQGYLGGEIPSNLSESSSFYGHGIQSQSFTITGWTPGGGGMIACAEAQKLDSSSSTLILSFPASNGAVNRTSSAYGTTKFCIEYEIA
jgi:hypothetical protein